MSLLRSIQNLAVDSNADISSLLRQCQILAFRLENDELKKWVDQELNGYKGVSRLPSYRIIHTNSRGNFVASYGRQLMGGNIPLFCMPEKFREDLEKAYCAQPISNYESLIKASPKGKNFVEPWPADLVAMYGGKIYEDYNCLSAWKEIPYGSMVALVEVVRNKILSFVLEIELEDPKAGEIPMGDSLLTNEKVNNVFHTTIMGNVGNFSQNGSEFSQSTVVTVIKGDFGSLKKQLVEYGIQTEEINELKNSMEKDDKDAVIQTKSLGKSVLSWVEGVLSKRVDGLKPVAQGVTADLLTKAILLYYGIQ